LNEGDFGLREVSKARVTSDVRVELSPAGSTVRVEGSGKVAGLAVEHPKLASEVVGGLDFAWRGRIRAELDGSALEVTDGEVDLGQLRFLVGGRLHRTPNGKEEGSLIRGASVDLAFEVPLTNCQAAYESLPAALLPKLGGMRFAGSLSAKGHARFEGGQIEKTFDVAWDGNLSCRVLEAPESIRVANFRKPFPKLVYTPEGAEKTMTFGPGTAEWVPYSAISKFMSVGALVCEDGRFHRHHGFDQEAIINSLRENLLAGAFKRGASTITMQLAKNLYLSREKVLARKLQEAVLTLYLEQELTKQEILELYFNLIEFGPMVYGIGPAARHWFNTSAADLTLGQSLYLASILQNPKKQFFAAGGAVLPARLNYLKKLMESAKKLHLISDAEAEAGLEENVVYGQPNATTPTAIDEPPASHDFANTTEHELGRTDPQNGMSSSSPPPLPKPPSKASPPPP